VWKALAGLVVLLLVAVVGLDQWQARRGEASLFGLSWPARPADPATTHRPRLLPAAEPPGAAAPDGGRRIAIVIDDLGGRRDVFDLVREVKRPVAVAVLPALPLSSAIAREAAALGMEVLLDLPMEPYRYPEVDPGPGALLMSMSREELQSLVGRHLAALPPAVGVINHMGSRMTEDRARLRAVLEVLAARRLFLLDAHTSSLSVAYDEARRMGLRAARRHLVIDQSRGEAGDPTTWEAVAASAESRGHVIVVAHGHPLTVRRLREHIPRWEARGLRLVPISQLAR
jgi:hypothetical protein